MTVIHKTNRTSCSGIICVHTKGYVYPKICSNINYLGNIGIYCIDNNLYIKGLSVSKKILFYDYI